VLPRERSCNTIVALPLLQEEEAFVGPEACQLPAAQIHEGNARS
jgi:hypothetical protein